MRGAACRSRVLSRQQAGLAACSSVATLVVAHIAIVLQQRAQEQLRDIMLSDHRSMKILAAIGPANILCHNVCC